MLENATLTSSCSQKLAAIALLHGIKLRVPSNCISNVYNGGDALAHAIKVRVPSAAITCRGNFK